MTYIYAQFDLDGVESTPNECIIIKEVHFYISDDKVHDRSYVAHYFGFILMILHNTR